MMGKAFYLGVALCIAGIVLMSLPQKPCEDCEDEVSEVDENSRISIVTDDEAEVTGD
jgi:hypothetical protein